MKKISIEDEVATISSLELGDLKSPFAPAEKGALGAAPANNTFGFNSIQDFSGVFGNHNSDLHQTHGDALGFYNYLHNFVEPNFWFKDSGVQTWQYEEPYDHWQNKYGVDAVLAFYHSGHGNMDGNGVFQAPMGGAWNGESWFFSNHDVKFANQVSRYIFWSTCLSCRVLGTNNPVRTWWASDNNPGFSMLFGFETVSVDNPNYGTNFWNHWKNGESFSTAWLNASWDIYHNQGPSCVASGNDANDANNRVFNERAFNWGVVARNYYTWRWYYAASVAKRNLAMPEELKIAEFEKATFNKESLRTIAGSLSIKEGLSMMPDGECKITNQQQSVSINKSGQLYVKLGEVNVANKKQISEAEAIKIAQQHIKEHNLNAGEKYELDIVRLSKVAGAKGSKNPKVDAEYVTDTMVQFRQIINGVPAINSDNGLIRITVDNDGKVANMHSSVKKIAKLNSFPKQMPLDPKNEKSLATAKAHAMIEKGFTDRIAKYNSSVKFVDDSEEIGYDVSQNSGKLVMQRVYELSFPEGLKKLVKVIVPIFE